MYMQEKFRTPYNLKDKSRIYTASLKFIFQLLIASHTELIKVFV